VDYTQVRYVRKPHGSAVGYVTYTNQKTLYVDPISMRDAAKLINIIVDKAKKEVL
jgi:predicted ribosome quality control (RQC) complex YloA/Tae2 family protein